MTAADETRAGARSLAAARVRGWFARLGRVQRPAAKRMRRWERRHLAAGAGLLVLILAVGLVLLDTVAIVSARQLPGGINRFFNVITDYGKSGWFLWPLGGFLAVAALLAGRMSKWTGLVVASLATRALYLFLAIALPGLFTNLIKGLIGRARPYVSGTADPYVFIPWTWTPAYASFPSGHATTAASVAFAFGALWPRLRPYLWLYALMIFASRIIVTAHHPTDVLGGAVVGLVGALLVRNYFAARALAFSIDKAGRIHAIPGPSWRRIKRVARRALAQ